jgi:hypothetical protein
MDRTTNPALDHGLWWAIELRARELRGSEGVDRESAGSRNPGETADAVWEEDADPDLLLELALRHFRDQSLDVKETVNIARAMRKVLEDGQPRQVGPVGRGRRVYCFDCREEAFSIRAGQGRILLPPDTASYLAGALAEPNRHNPAGSVAA